MTASGAADPDRLRRRLDRERAARHEAEAIAERVTSDLYAALQELTGLNASLRDFVAVAAHDLRAPLTSILGFTALMRRDWDRHDDASREGFLVAIERSGQHLKRLTEDLLTISSIEANALATHVQEVQLRPVVEHTLAGLADTPVELDVSPQLIVLADPDHLERALTNYLSNAVKYGAPPFALRAQALDASVDVRVSDCGAGVPADFVPRLFDRFARADEARRSGVGGTGLGLAIVRGLARSNGGDAWYETRDPNGACFVLRVPRPIAAGASL
ncbi:MAG TPA: HAMP domain-containing sensor histidine kinase [Nitriliruptorales bacterium]